MLIIYSFLNNSSVDRVSGSLGWPSELEAGVSMRIAVIGGTGVVGHHTKAPACLSFGQYISKRFPVGSRKYERPLMPSRVHRSEVVTPFWRSHPTMGKTHTGKSRSRCG